MGVKNGAKTLHSVTGLTLADVAAMGKGLANEKQIMPRIVADCSNLLFVFSKCTSVVSAVAGHLSRIAASGVIMVPVCDGAIRPISKQATNKRIADKELSRIKAFHCRTKMIELKNRLVQESLSQVERDAITAEIRQQDTKMKRNETQSQRAMPQNFANDLEYELSHSNAHSVDEESAGGFVDHVVVAEFQADSYMAAQSINQNAVMVMTKDSDIPIIAGDDCISIKSFTKGKYEIVSTSESTLKHAMSYLPEASKQRVQFNAAANPVFDGVSNVRLRALIMLVLGCDVYIPGMKAVKGMSALRFVHSEKRACEDELFASLHQKFMEANKLSKQEVDTYIDAIIYEPTNHARVLVESPTEPSCCIERTYLFERPTSLPRYLEQYSIDDKFKTDSIFDGPATLTCKGVGERKHLFLAHEGHDACHNCKVDVCLYCRGSIGDNIFCLSCLATETIVPAYGSVESKTILEMRAELKDKFHFDGVEELDSDEVEDAYTTLSSSTNYHAREEDVRFPLYPSSELDLSVKTKWEELFDIDFKEGAAFLHDPDLDAKHVPGLLNLFGALTTFEPCKETGWKNQKSLYAALPSIIIKFASDCRIDSGYRLLMRCIRHAFDSRTQSLDDKTARLILHDGELGIHLSSEIPASMKTSVYRSEIVVTPTKILCCKCSCHCGGQGSERVLCVHNLPLLFLLTSLLFDGLAENLLCDLAACLRGDMWNEDVWSNVDKSAMKMNMVRLMGAAGDQVISCDLDRTSINDLLENFLVGTETRKKWKQKIRTPPKPSQLGPISAMKFVSTEKQLVAATKLQVDDDKNQSVSSIANNTDRKRVTTFEPNYAKVTLLMDAADCHSKVGGDAIGVKLLTMRSDNQWKNLSREEIFAMSNEVQRDWKELRELSLERTHNFNPNSAEKVRRKPSTYKLMPTHCQPMTRSRASTETTLRRPGQRLPTKKRSLDTAPTPLPKRARVEVRCVSDSSGTKKVSIRCAKCSKNNVSHPYLKFKCLPRYPVELQGNPTLQAVIRRQKKILLHEEVMDCVVGDRNCRTKKYICSEHQFEVVTKSKTFTYKGEKMTRSFQLTVPVGAGMKSSVIPSEASKGLGGERAVRRMLEAVSAKVKPIYEGGEDSMESELAQTQLALQQVVELSSKEQRGFINPTVRIASGLGLEVGNASSMAVEGRNFFHADLVKKPYNKICGDPPVVLLGMSDAEVKRRTGFTDERALLTYIFVVCNGDINIMKRRASSLTWFEEWFLHFEYQWGRSLTRICDVKSVYGLQRDETIIAIVSQKYTIEFGALLSWPMYSSYIEDVTTRNKKWAMKYLRVRPIMWDMTNIPAYSFSDADYQRLTFSEYYGENCFKGGVSVQLNGWIRAGALWPGRVSDSDYNRREGYLERQQEFQESDLVEMDGNHVVLPFTNVYDKGYRAVMAAWKSGKQGVLQPTFAPSDRRFSGRETKLSASIASDRGGNERAVNVSKRAAYISRGFRPNMEPEIFDMAWRTWSFKSNFMFKPVL